MTKTISYSVQVRRGPDAGMWSRHSTHEDAKAYQHAVKERYGRDAAWDHAVDDTLPLAVGYFLGSTPVHGQYHPQIGTGYAYQLVQGGNAESAARYRSECVLFVGLTYSHFA